MSFAKRFNIATAMEEIKEDTTGEFSDNLEKQANEIAEIQESIEFSTDEIGKGLEAITDLIKLSNRIEKNETSGVSTEGYSDIAQMAFESILNRIGIEDGEVFDKDDPTGKDAKDITPKKSGKIRKFIEKMLEVIRNIIKTISDFFKRIYNIITNKISKAIKRLEDFRDSVNVILMKGVGFKDVVIENPMFFQDKKLLTVGDIFENGPYNYIDNAFGNIDAIFGEATIVSGLIVRSNIEDNVVDLLDDRTARLSRIIKGKKEKSGIHVSPEGFIQLEKQENGTSKFSFVKENPENPVKEQTVILKAFSRAFINVGIDNLVRLSNANEVLFAEMENTFNKHIPKKLNKIKDELKTATGDKEQELISKATNIKILIDYLTSVRKTHDSYVNEIISIINYYTGFINEATRKAKANAAA